MSSRRIVNLEDFSGELGNFAKASLEKKRKAVAAGLAASIPDLVQASPVDTGLYAQSWDFSVSERSAMIGNHAPYAGVIEHGARPFTPPIAPLLAWAKRKLSGGSVATGQRETNYSPEVWALAKAVQKKIAKEGMMPHHIMQQEIPRIMQHIREAMKNAV